MTRPSRPSILHLLHKARSGDDRALGQLFETYREYITLLARLQIDARIKTKVSPSDVAQDTFLLAYRGFADFRGKSEAELIGWLRRILANRLVGLAQWYTRGKRDVELELRLARELDGSSATLGQWAIADRQLDPRSVAMLDEQAVRLARALDRLKPQHREVIVLRHLQDLPFADVAARMDRTIDSVKGLWVRALSTLRRELEDGL